MFYITSDKQGCDHVKTRMWYCFTYLAPSWRHLGADSNPSLPKYHWMLINEASDDRPSYKYAYTSWLLGLNP